MASACNNPSDNITEYAIWEQFDYYDQKQNRVLYVDMENMDLLPPTAPNFVFMRETYTPYWIGSRAFLRAHSPSLLFKILLFKPKLATLGSPTGTLLPVPGRCCPFNTVAVIFPFKKLLIVIKLCLMMDVVYKVHASSCIGQHI